MLIVGFVLGFAMVTLSYYCGKYVKAHEPKYSDYGYWLDIKKYPIPSDLRRFIVTDGKDVQHQYSATYDRFGNVVFGLGDAVVTHWMYLPAPKGKKC